METTVIITGAIAAIVLAGAIILTILDLKRKKGEKLANPSISLGLITVHAQVTDVKTEADAEGLYAIEFKTDDGEAITVSVSEEMREGFEAGLSGELSITDGILTTFIPDGYTTDEENA